MAQPTFNPAATFNLITNSNTFAHWVTTTNNLVQQNNDLAANNFYKGTGTLYLNDSTLALQANGPAVFSGSAYFNAATIKTLTTTGDLVLAGNTLYQGTTFLVNSGSYYLNNGSFGVYRPGSANSAIRWNESQKYWDIFDVTNNNQATAYSQILTANMISSSLTSTSNLTLATSSTVNTLYAMVNSTSAGSSNTFIGINGTANPINGIITLRSNNGVQINATSNIVFINTPQNLNVASSPTFASLTLGTPLPVSQGGTGANTFLGALNNLLPPTGQVGGYVLTTTGLGTYYWGAGGGGGGGGVGGGNTITTYRAFFTAADGQTVFTGAPTYTIGSGQLRVYIGGVRQFNDAYTETSTTSFTLGTGLKSGEQVMAEVDAYTSAFYANNTAYTSNTTYLSLSQNTVQLGIDGALGFTKTAYDTANAASLNASAAYAAANNVAPQIQPAFNAANSAGSYANSAFARANSIASSVVASITGTTNQISANASTGNIVLSLPQSINTTSSVVFAGANVTTSNITTSFVGTELVTVSSQIFSLGVGTAASGTSGEIRATNNITAYYSDDKLKTRLGNIDNALDKLMTLNGFYYQANETAQALGYAVKKEVGVSAQEVQNILPEVVVPAPIDDKYLTVHYERIIPLIIEAIKELKTEVNELRGQIKW